MSNALTVRQYEQYLERVGCAGQEGADAVLKCLRQVDVTLLESTATDMLSEYYWAGTHPFQPVSGKYLLPAKSSAAQAACSFLQTPSKIHVTCTAANLSRTAGAVVIPRLPSETWDSGSWNHVPALVSWITDEGSSFTPQNLTTDDEAWAWMSNLYPRLDAAADREVFNRLYPDPQAPGSPYADSRGQAAQFSRLSDAYGDSTYISAAQEIAARLAAADVPVWKMHWNTNNSAASYLGISHGADVPYAWAEPGAQYPPVGSVLVGYYASFIVGGDPNTHRAEGAAEWKEYTEAGSEGLGWQVKVSPNGTWNEVDNVRREAIEYWRSIPVKLDH